MDSPTRPDLSDLQIRRDPTSDPEPARPASQGRWLWVLIPVLVVAAAAAVFFVRSRSQSFTVETAVVSRLSPAAARAVLTATGYVVAQRKAAVASKGTGRLEILNVEEGDHVRIGDVIGRLESQDVEATLASARAAVGQAEAEILRSRAVAKETQILHERARRLLADSLISQADYDNAEARDATAQAGVATAEASLRSARANVQYAVVQVENTYIRAPFDGTVLTKNADVGEVVAPFASSASSRGAVVTLADMGSLEVEADVSESNIRQIRAGQPCIITLDASPAEPYRGRVKRVVPTADRSKATVLTKIEFVHSDERVLPEMSAKVSFLTSETDTTQIETRTVLAAPATAIVERQGRSVAFVVRGPRAQQMTVDAGTRYGDSVEIRSGLHEGDIVVLAPPERLRDGSRVRSRS